METEKFLLRLEETLAQLTRQQEAICAELVAMRERVDAIDERTAAAAPGRAPTSSSSSSTASAPARRSARPASGRGSRSPTWPV
ncbi:MAG: hypothetical protein ABFS41_03910 [Myxococcota bacterium]